MSDRYKYAINGIYKCENFAEQVEQNRFPEYEFESRGGIDRWHFKCTLITEDHQAFLYPSIFCHRKPKVQIRIFFNIRTFFNILKKDGSSGSMVRENALYLKVDTYKLLGKPFDVSELLNPENEYLDDEGSLSIEYGIHVDAIMDDHKIWNFNFIDTVFNYTGEENQTVECAFRLSSRRELYCSSEILNFHCPHFVEQSSKIVLDGGGIFNFLDCLQILHGVQLQIGYYDNFNNLKIAHSFNLSNVIHYCDRPYNQCYEYRFKSISFRKLVKLNLRHVLAEKLRRREQKKVIEIAKKLDFTEATGEAMKTFVAKILYN